MEHRKISLGGILKRTNFSVPLRPNQENLVQNSLIRTGRNQVVHMPFKMVGSTGARFELYD